MERCKHLRYDNGRWLCDGDFDVPFPEAEVPIENCNFRDCPDYDNRKEDDGRIHHNEP